MTARNCCSLHTFINVIVVLVGIIPDKKNNFEMKRISRGDIETAHVQTNTMVAFVLSISTNMQFQ